MNILLVIFGFLSGVLGGMGMGGGTLLIPLLSFLDIPQQTIQAINLISFLPMAVFALVLHFKNGLIKTKNIIWLILPAIASAVLGAILVKNANEKLLRICFGVLLVVLGVWQMIKSVVAIIKNKKVENIINNEKNYISNKNLK